MESIERTIAALPPDVRKLKRQELSLPILNKLRNFVSKLNAPPKSLLGKAAAYVISQWSWLTARLEDGRLEISNNLAERSIKPFVIGQKNFLFANTPSGARSSAILFSMIQTVKENSLDPYQYLTWVLKKAPYSICLIHLMLIPFFPLTLRENAVLGMFPHSVRFITLT